MQWRTVGPAACAKNVRHSNTQATARNCLVCGSVGAASPPVTAATCQPCGAHHGHPPPHGVMATHRTVVPKTLGRYRVWRSIRFCFALAHYHLWPSRSLRSQYTGHAFVIASVCQLQGVAAMYARSDALGRGVLWSHGCVEQKERKQRTGVEPVAFWVATRCSTNLSYRCWCGGCTTRRGIAVEDSWSGGMCQECAAHSTE